MEDQTVQQVHGITPALMLGGFYVATTKTGRSVAVSDRTYRLLKARRSARKAA